MKPDYSTGGQVVRRVIEDKRAEFAGQGANNNKEEYNAAGFVDKCHRQSEREAHKSVRVALRWGRVGLPSP